MTNKQYAVITEIITQLRTLTSDIAYVGEYPDGLSQIGQRFPAVIIEDGNEQYNAFAGNKFQNFMEIKLHLFIHIKTGQTKMKSMLDLQADINDKLLADFTLNSTVINCVPVSVEKETTENEAGQQIAHRVMTYMVEIHDTRID